MTDSIHGHEVLHMMLADGQAYTPESLVGAIEERFGAGARFHTCSAEELTAAGLVEFLRERGKFTPAGESESFTADASRMCND